jgi:hypothetical protein
MLELPVIGVSMFYHLKRIFLSTQSRPPSIISRSFEISPRQRRGARNVKHLACVVGALLVHRTVDHAHLVMLLRSFVTWRRPMAAAAAAFATAGGTAACMRIEEDTKVCLHMRSPPPFLLP